MLKFEFWDGHVLLQSKAKDIVDLGADVGLLISMLYSKIHERAGSEAAEEFKRAVKILTDDAAPLWTTQKFPGIELKNTDEIESFLKSLAEQKGTAADESGT